MASLQYPSIPLPDATLTSLQKTMVVVIQVLRIMTGRDVQSRSGTVSNRNMAHTFIQDTQPDAINPGDFWLCQHPATFSVWDGANWIKIATIPP